MSELTIEIGKRIRMFRKKRGLTLLQLSELIHKNLSTVSKYETGDISVDVETLYAIADALHVHIEQLIYLPSRQKEEAAEKSLCPNFFKGASRFYSYVFDGRSNQLSRCVFEIGPELDQGRSKITMYMNFSDYDHCEDCENTYQGYIKHYDAVTSILLTNQDTQMEVVHIQILATFMDSATKWGLFSGLSFRPMMPVASKMLFSRERLPETAKLIQQLKISREDIRILRLYNSFAIT